MKRYAKPLLCMVAAAATMVAAAGCSSKSDDAPPATATLDLDTSCANRAAWKATGTPDCSSCLAKVVLDCGCSHIGYEGVCQTKSEARIAEADCSSDLGHCLAACAADCRCETACYAGHDACRARATDLNSCVVNACETDCR